VNAAAGKVPLGSATSAKGRSSRSVKLPILASLERSQTFWPDAFGQIIPRRGTGLALNPDVGSESPSLSVRAHSCWGFPAPMFWGYLNHRHFTLDLFSKNKKIPLPLYHQVLADL